MHDRADDRKSSALPRGPPAHSGPFPKISPTLSCFVLLATTLYYSLAEEHGPGGRLWQQHPTTLFAQSSLVTSVYWILLFLLQLLYLWCVWSSNVVYAAAAARVGPHFVVSSLLLSAFVHLWVRSHFWLAELPLLASFFTLSSAYFRHPNTPLAIHVGAVAGPLAWNFAALYWAGAAALRSTHPVAKIAAHLSICGWLAYGTFYLVTYKDYVVGFALSLLSASTAVGTSSTGLRELPLQSALAFAVAAVLFIVSLAVASPGLLGREPFARGRIVSEDRERAPLLACDGRQTKRRLVSGRRSDEVERDAVVLVGQGTGAGSEGAGSEGAGSEGVTPGAELTDSALHSKMITERSAFDWWTEQLRGCTVHWTHLGRPARAQTGVAARENLKSTARLRALCSIVRTVRQPTRVAAAQGRPPAAAASPSGIEISQAQFEEDKNE
ncbi:hypothetical protein N0V95_009691 [Ascochyta clinopodiicola]|nr:hypothetical protein N0V95_009691 [Ascochyta clinopodiicola]